MSATHEAPVVAAGPTACMLCGGARMLPRFPSRRTDGRSERTTEPYRITHSERRFVHAIVRCADCGMVMLPLHHAPGVRYADAADPYYVEQADERLANAHRLLDLIPAGGRLLEIGCACGFLLVAARERGFAVQGVEMSAWAAAYARDTYGLDVRTGSIEALGLPAASYEVVVMADVIEHLVDPRQTVREIHRLLRPGGRLVVLTPDVGSVMARLFGARWWGLLDDHYVYFSRPTLRRFLTSEGFAVDRLAALGRAFRLSHWTFKLAPYSERLHAALAGATRVLHIDGLQVPINLGDQMACVARKP